MRNSLSQVPTSAWIWSLLLCLHSSLWLLSTCTTELIRRTRSQIGWKRFGTGIDKYVFFLCEPSMPDYFHSQVAVYGLSRVFCMEFEQLKRPRQRHIEHVTHVLDGGSSISCGGRREKRKKKIRSPVLTYNKWESSAIDCPRDSPITPRYQRVGDTPDHSPVHTHMFEGDVKEIKRALRSFMNRIYDRDAQQRVALEWRVVALVLDRMFFFIYLSTILVSLMTIFPWKEALTKPVPIKGFTWNEESHLFATTLNSLV